MYLEITRSNRTGIRRLLRAKNKSKPQRKVGAPRGLRDNGRAQKMAEMYHSGKTLQETGSEFGVTRERVRQVLRVLGVAPISGGSKSKSAIREKEKIEYRKQQRETFAQNCYRCSYDELRAIQGTLPLMKAGSPAAVYMAKMGDAENRAIPWEFTFPQWWSVWAASGKWNMRGRGKNGYCLARNNDTGPYSITNVRIISNAENASESFNKHPAEERFARSLTRHNGPLTKRQHEIYSLYQGGLGPKEISQRIGISKGTVAVVLTTAKHRLGLL